MVGHASAATTLDTYSDLFDDDLDAVVDRLNEVGETHVGKPILKRENGSPFNSCRSQCFQGK